MSGQKTLSDFAINTILRKGKILQPHEEVSDMFKRVADSVIHGNNEGNKDLKFRDRILDHLFHHRFVPSTPIMTNAGVHVNRPLSACVVPPVDLNGDLKAIKATVDQYHEDGMGTGFDLSDAKDPIQMLIYLNQIGIEGLKTQDRPVGNMGVLSIYHPKIREFIHIKENADGEGVMWAFNISVALDDKFMEAAEKGEQIQLADGTLMYASELLYEIAEVAHDCADPGIVFLDRMNERNPTPHLGKYISTAPCGEVGLAPGETCQFGSINLVEFVENGKINWLLLEGAVRDFCRYLDDALEYSLGRYKHVVSRSIMGQKRKIGIGVCGFSFMLQKLGIPYDSEEAVAISHDIMSFVSFYSKVASVELAQKRGPFMGWGMSQLSGNTKFLERSRNHPGSISSGEWGRVHNQIASNGIRNATTTALPPTGRSSLAFDTSQQIEPDFHLICANGSVNPQLDKYIETAMPDKRAIILSVITKTGSIQDADAPDSVKKLYLTGPEIVPLQHLDVLQAWAEWTDESVSKTINLPSNSKVEDVLRIYSLAHKMGLKGITIFRDGSRKHTPMVLSSNK